MSHTHRDRVVAEKESKICSLVRFVWERERKVRFGRLAAAICRLRNANEQDHRTILWKFRLSCSLFASELFLSDSAQTERTLWKASREDFCTRLERESSQIFIRHVMRLHFYTCFTWTTATNSTSIVRHVYSLFQTTASRTNNKSLVLSLLGLLVQLSQEEKQISFFSKAESHFKLIPHINHRLSYLNWTETPTSWPERHLVELRAACGH